MATLDSVKGAVQNAPENRPVSKEDGFKSFLSGMEQDIMQALPNHMTSEHFSRVILTAVKTNPKLLECSPVSVASSIMLAAQLGLEPGTFGH